MSTTPITKLNLGCGMNKAPAEEGWLNVDAWVGCKPDVAWNLEHVPWELGQEGLYLPDSTVTEVHMNHVLEHLGADPTVFQGVIQELYRVCADGARLTVTVPSVWHQDFWGDPTHVRGVVPELFILLNREACAEIRARGGANTPLAEMWGVDFVLERNEAVIDPGLSHYTSTDPQLQTMMMRQLNVVKEWGMQIRVRKPAWVPVDVAPGAGETA